jgi:hypothetical protein
VAPESAIHSGPTGGVRLMVPNERARAAWSHPETPGGGPEGPEGGTHEAAGGGAGKPPSGGPAGGVPVSMATGGREAVPVAW